MIPWEIVNALFHSYSTLTSLVETVHQFHNYGRMKDLSYALQEFEFLLKSQRYLFVVHRQMKSEHSLCSDSFIFVS